MDDVGGAAGSPVSISLPASREALSALRAGDAVEISGDVYTARDATHVRLAAALAETAELPFGLAGQVLFYAGPTPPAAGRPVGAVGPTTARRMDSFTPGLLAAGISATIGKGVRSEGVREACRDNGAVYFVAVGGSAALLARHVIAVEPVAYEDLGTEALVRMTLDRFPVFVGIDASGRDIFGGSAQSGGGETA